MSAQLQCPHRHPHHAVFLRVHTAQETLSLGYFMDASTPTCLKLASCLLSSLQNLPFPLLHHSKWHHQPSDAQLEARATVVIFKAIHPPLSLGSRSTLFLGCPAYSSPSLTPRPGWSFSSTRMINLTFLLHILSSAFCGSAAELEAGHPWAESRPRRHVLFGPLSILKTF